MKSKHIAFLFSFLTLFFINKGSHAQDRDSINFVTVEWKTTPLKKGIVWKQANIKNLFDSQQEINIIEIDLKNKKNAKKIRLAALANGLEKTSALAQQHDAIVAINGGFFDMKNGGAVDFIKVDNQVINTTANPSARANAYLAFDKKKLLISSDSTRIALYPNILLSGPLLLKDSKPQSLPKNPFNKNRHPRTAIAIKDKHLILFTVDGRNAKSQGLNLDELAKLFQWYGCEDAMNLDGGGSTTMYIKGQADGGIVNYPSDNKLFDHLGERSVANIIYLLN